MDRHTPRRHRILGVRPVLAFSIRRRLSASTEKRIRCSFSWDIFVFSPEVTFFHFCSLGVVVVHQMVCVGDIRAKQVKGFLVELAISRQHYHLMRYVRKIPLKERSAMV